METPNFSSYTLGLYTYKLFESFKRLAECPSDVNAMNILTLKDLYELIDSNFAELHNKNNLMNLLPILHYTIKLSTSKNASTKIDICDFFQKLLNKHKDNEDDQRLALQIYYQLLKSLENQNSHLNTDELFHTLADLLFSSSSSKLLAANVLNCLKLQIVVSKRTDVLDRLWQRVSKMDNENSRDRQSQILVQLIDDFLQYIDNFYRNDIFIKIILTLLVSNVREERKIAIYLLKKAIPLIVKRAQDVPIWEVNYSEELSNSWNSYTTVLENLEEKQSHLILPTLETIKKIKLANMWMDLLYKQLLTHNNTLVLRWIIEYMLDNFVCKDLRRELLKCILEAVNATNLYNYDNYCLSAVKVQTFLNCDLKQFFEVCADINWKSVPLHFWLMQISSNQLSSAQLSISNETLIKIASRVRVLQNRIIRGDVIKSFENVFTAKIETLNIDEYLQLLECLYNVLDDYFKYATLTKKILAYDKLPELKLTQRLYGILTTDKIYSHLFFTIEEQEVILDAFQAVPKEHHHWFRFMFVFDFQKSDKQMKFCRNKYDLDLSKIVSHDAFIRTLVDKLVWHKSENYFVHEKAVDYFVKAHTEYIELLSNSSLEDLLDKGGIFTVWHIAELLANSDEVINEAILDNFLKNVFKFTGIARFYIYRSLFTSCNSNLAGDKVLELVKKILENDVDDDFSAHEALFCSNLIFPNIVKNLLNDPKNIVHKIFHRKVTHGDARVEERYVNNWELENSRFLHHKLIEYIAKMKDVNLEVDMLHYLLELNNEVSKKKPRYFENSHEHRVKMRIASCVLRLIKSSTKVWRKQLHQQSLWDIIMLQNNQLNITYCYERAIAYCTPNINHILMCLNQISIYTAGIQVSIIAICCNYYMINMSVITKSTNNEIFEKLLALTMGANFQIRLYSQLAVYKILVKSERNSNTRQLIKTIRAAVGEQLDDLLKDIRLNVNETNILGDNIVLYGTNAPFDEVDNLTDKFNETCAKSRKQFCKKINTTQQRNNTEKNTCMEIYDVQRKMNPLTDIIPNNNLISYPEFKIKKIKENDVIVVATLIDKLPNLGGVARTCEVLGIKNLIMNSSKHIDKCDFQNLSMTAEKGLNIGEVKQENLMEFLVQKQIEGYEIVGAEQTAKSQSFVDFKFPQKCIILLGHEKEGIPANILSILNHTVEIPQFGMVRSLNVHVTGALFMWEYCKQHIIKSLES